jgi:hypothetical protein
MIRRCEVREALALGLVNKPRLEIRESPDDRKRVVTSPTYSSGGLIVAQGKARPVGRQASFRFHLTRFFSPLPVL